ncbi:hypothetical protein FHX76_001277 [Lysinibacter cavernae]|uniref:Uncharacterized protein n=1 Tax=Lysinibacter cavernae TaxID=1640652 RepID=A0A7X5TTE7_9MICO|nr:hypothetical protein [Lysinibacter cavernae]
MWLGNPPAVKVKDCPVAAVNRPFAGRFVAVSLLRRSREAAS